MTHNERNVIPVTMALLLHVIVFGSLVFAFDFRSRATPAVPLALTATLVTDNAVVIPPRVEEPPPQPDPEPEPDTSEQDRIRAEEQKRLEDARVEQERLDRIRKAEEEAEAERQRQALAEKRRQEEEARKERERLAAERQRQEEIERQRRENERLRAEAEAARQAELTAESNRLEAMQANAKAAYVYAIQQRIQSRWVKPPTAIAGIECIVNIRQLPGGEVVDVSIGRCNGDATVRRSIETAVYQASPLPNPPDPSVFDRNIVLEFRPRD
ncbi:MAG: cell envelope integrity protein TolA [Woeseiaceae bacterium]|nr:cell envelope integrity protein TolA [Woeseiaceae bacterium]